MTDWRSRTELLIGDKNLARLAKSSVLVVGLGGVGAMAAEMISRSGVGSMTIIDGDTIQPSNINRQIPAINSTIGKTKTEVMESRLLDINPDLNLTVVSEFIRDERMKEILSTGFDYVVDAIDTLSPKIFLIYHSVMNNLRVVSSMGAGGKMDPTLIQVTDISGTYNCKLARIIRKRLHKLRRNQQAKPLKWCAPALKSRRR